MRIAFITPPLTKPSEPGISAPAAAALLRRLGADAFSIDASIGWHRFALSRPHLEAALGRMRAAGAPAGALLASKRAMWAVTQPVPAFRRPQTYRSRRVYTSAVNDLENALTLASRDFPWLRLGVAMVGSASPGQRPESSAWLAEVAAGATPFDDYFVRELLPALARAGVTHVGLSLTFQQQAPAAFRLARLLGERLPGVTRLLGGPLVASWQAAAIDLDRRPFELVHRVIAGADAEMAALASELTGEEVRVVDVVAAAKSAPLAVSPDEGEWQHYLAPLPVVPAAVGRGCYWRRCTFCPDHLHPRHRPCAPESLEQWLREVAARFPDGAMLHLTDSALPPDYLSRVADCIQRERLPLSWHGFVRVEPELARPDFAHHLAAGGCAMLQIGVETGSPRLLETMGKGSTPELARAVLRAGGAAGLRNHVYLLFGMPLETDADRELTLELVEAEGASIHAVNTALLNLPRGSPMHRHPARFGITRLVPFHDDTDLSLYDDFRCGASHPRLEARRWLQRRFFKSPRVRAITAALRSPLKANHLCFLDAGAAT